MNVTDSEVTITNNIVDTILSDAISISSNLPVLVSGNTLSNIAESAIIYGNDTDVMRNSITTVCTTASTECAAIRNDPLATGPITSFISENSIKDVGTGVSGNKNIGILANGVDSVIISKNGIQNAQYGVRLIDSSNSTVSQNTLLASRVNTFSVVQNTPAGTA